MIQYIAKTLQKPVDNSPLVVFRILLGLLLSFEVLGMMFNGMLHKIYLAPAFTFTFIGFEWLQPLPGNGMYFYFITMAILAWMIMLGWRYRVACILFCILWTGSYLMQKTFYNNHNYLFILLAGAMAFMPANRYYSMDVRRKNITASLTCPRWCNLFFILQIGIVYTFAGIAKIYPDWLAGLPIKIWFTHKQNYFLIGPLLNQDWFQLMIAYGGVFFDLLIVPLLLWKRTRVIAFIAALFFHLFNAYIFDIGTFPFVMISLCVFFFPPDQISRLFFKKKQIDLIPAISNNAQKAVASNWLMDCLSIYFLVQIALPLRHRFIPSDVTWTEEGHRMSWRMMLRSKKGDIWFKVKDKSTRTIEKVFPYEYLTKTQEKALARSPDLIWQFAQFLKKEYHKKGKDIAVFAQSSLSLNGHPERSLVDSEVDLASESWNRWGGNQWILPYEQSTPIKSNLLSIKKSNLR